MYHFPFISIIDKNDKIDFDLNRNKIKSNLKFIDELVESCKLDFIYSLIFFKPPVIDNVLDLKKYRNSGLESLYDLRLNAIQLGRPKVFVTSVGYFLNTSFYEPIVKGLKYYKICVKEPTHSTMVLLPDAVCYLVSSFGIDFKRDYTKNANPDLLRIQELNQSLSVDPMKMPISEYEEIDRLLNKHLGSPKLIPFDWEAKIAYAKTCSKELQRHLTEKRGIKLD
jgi:hypothetical protein